MLIGRRNTGELFLVDDCFRRLHISQHHLQTNKLFIPEYNGTALSRMVVTIQAVSEKKTLFSEKVQISNFKIKIDRVQDLFTIGSFLLRAT